MLRGLVNDVPTVVLVLVVVGMTVGLVLLGVHIVRRAVPATRDAFDAEVSSQILGVVSALLGLLLAFVIVIEFQNVDDADGSVSREADSIAAIVRDSDAFSAADKARIRGAAGDYVRAVVDDEWPRMRDDTTARGPGGPSARCTPRFNRSTRRRARRRRSTRTP